ncbi:unnamed protein product [Gordionus sp. m RMFG-2023]|uniref:T-complex protein 1 subunit gamma-like n=1 Tax=Gordionus sp. m RMFG-2023 TaxID=3053472 RepID=UPI0030DEB23A
MAPHTPFIIISQNTKRESGRKVQIENISAAKIVADVIRTCLGPRAMLKMLMDPQGGIVVTSDGNAILREIAVKHPAAKSMIEISRTQDEEVGDGTTSVIILAGEFLGASEVFLNQNIHPTIIISAYRLALDDIQEALNNKLSFSINIKDQAQLLKIVKSCVNTKFAGKWSDLICNIAIKAVNTVALDHNGTKEIDIKRYARVEKIAGGLIEDSHVLNGIMINKDTTHPEMRRKIVNPRILLLDCNLEYKKGESMTNMEFNKEQDFQKMLELEEDTIKKDCDKILEFKPDMVFTEKGVSDLAQHYLMKANVTVLRRLRKTDNNRIAKVCGATIVNQIDEIREEDIGTKAGLFEMKQIGDEYYTYIVDCHDPKACSIVLRGPSKDILNEIERNLIDAMSVLRNVMLQSKLVYGGGSVEMALSKILSDKAKSIIGIKQWPYLSLARSLEVIPRTLIQNCGGDVIRTMTNLRAKHSISDDPESQFYGIDGEKGTVCNIKALGIYEPLAVKLQIYKTAIETAILLLRIDDIVSGTKKESTMNEKQQNAPPTEESMKD